MRNLILFTLIGLLFWGCSGGEKNESSKSRSEQELLASYLNYHKKKDLPGILGLFYQQDTPPFVLDSVKKRSRKNFDFAIASAQIEEIPPEKLAKVMAGVAFNGKTLIPNLTPVKQISVKFVPTGQGEEMRPVGASIMFGKVNDVCYFILSKHKVGGPVETTPITPPPNQ
ncbi:MAG: hypothetical protein HGA96_03700 [Desulfobulbaceae bacterium]|nr:hypothetical protein [Desulfobulbaceae bacterium]